MKRSTAWKKDEERAHCAKCRSEFGFFNRRHHCRGCGDIFCKACSGLDVDCSHRGYKTPQRVCVICASQKHALLISQSRACAAELLLARSNFEAAISAAEVGVAANNQYNETTIVRTKIHSAK